MKKLKSTLPNMVLSLTVITAVCGAIIGVFYSLTKEPIAQMENEAKVQAIKDVAPAFDNDPEADKWIWNHDGAEYTVYPAFNHGNLAGAAVKTLSMDGFAGEITVMAGFDADGTLRDYQVLSQGETPGLGSKMQMWFRDPAGARSVMGKNPSAVSFYVVKDTDNGGEIDGITAATISSRAFLGSLRDAYEAYRQWLLAHPECKTSIPEAK